MKTVTLNTTQRAEIIDITKDVAAIVREENIGDGLCVVYIPHTTASVTVNENWDPDVKTDFVHAMNKAFPQSSEFRHSEGNSDSHIKTILTNPSQTFIVENGELVLGQWQGIYFAEWDGPRTRQFFVKVIKG